MKCLNVHFRKVTQVAFWRRERLEGKRLVGRWYNSPDSEPLHQGGDGRDRERAGDGPDVHIRGWGCASRPLVSGLNDWHDQPLIRWEHRRASGDGGGKEASLLEFLRHHRKGVQGWMGHRSGSQRRGLDWMHGVKDPLTHRWHFGEITCYR